MVEKLRCNLETAVGDDRRTLMLAQEQSETELREKLAALQTLTTIAEGEKRLKATEEAARQSQAVKELESHAEQMYSEGCSFRNTAESTIQELTNKISLLGSELTHQNTMGNQRLAEANTRLVEAATRFAQTEVARLVGYIQDLEISLRGNSWSQNADWKKQDLSKA